MTEEHIIPQSLGGKLSAWIYCKDCNDKFGKGIDAELFNNFRYFPAALKVDRKRGKNQPYDVYFPQKDIELTCDGREFRRKKPIVEIKKDGDKVVYVEIIARSGDELDKITLGIKRKHSLDYEFEHKNETIAGPIEVEREFIFDNSLIRRAVSEISYGLICIKMPDRQVFSDSFDDIRS
jgi:hypothetical protein